MKIRLASPMTRDSIVDGPGLRAVIWAQGCFHNCPGCHNPCTHNPFGGYTGVISGDVCPHCGRHESDGPVGFERIRRITGYLVGTLDRFNNAKRAEVRDRVKHNQCGAEEEANAK